MSIVRLLPAWLHAIADYAVAITLIVVALVVHGSDKAVATGIVVGAVVLLVSLLTRYPLGLIKVLPFTIHSAGDYLAVVLLVAAPFALSFFHNSRGLSIVYLAAGAAVLLVSLITNYQYSPRVQANTARTPKAAKARPQVRSTSDEGDARQWYNAAARQREMPVEAPAYVEVGYREPSYGRAAPSPAANAGQTISLRDAIAASRQREAS